MRVVMQRSLILAVFLFLLKGFCSEVVTDGDAVVVDDIEDIIGSSSDVFNIDNIHYILVSTMDGKITAIDVNNNGNIVWSSDLDGVPLLSGTLHSYQVSSQKPSYVVVPSLDGSLYAFDTSDNALNPIPVSAGKSVMVGNDALAGGTILSSTGIDPATGQIRYHCSPDNCEQKNALSGSLYTLLVQRSTQIIRAADPFSGLERWNTSVGDYTISLASNNAFDHHSKEQKSSNIRFLLRPPDGVITALDSCGYPFWRHDFKNPIAKTWQLLYGKISEVSLFDWENIETGEIDGPESSHELMNFEAPFYFGTVNSEPYLIFSDKMRGELRRNEESSYKQIASNSAKHSLYLPDFSVTDLIKRSYSTANAVEADPVNGVPNLNSFSSRNCRADDTSALMGGTQIQRIGYSMNENGNLGWYILRSGLKHTSESKSNKVAGKDSQQCRESGLREQRAHFVRRISKKINKPVSGWWRVSAIALAAVIAIIIISSSMTYGYLSLFYQKKKKLNDTEPHDSENDVRNGFMQKFRPNSNSVILDSSQLLTKPVKLLNSKSIPFELQCSKNSTSSAAYLTTSSLFVSKFLEDFIPEKWLGRGGYGIVFKCRNRLDDRSYAIKRIAVSNTTTAIEKVRREVRTMAKLDHPGIIRYFHTWMERPPENWQQAKDKEILRNIRGNSMQASGDAFPIIGSSIDEPKPICCYSKKLYKGNSNARNIAMITCNMGTSESGSWAVGSEDSNITSSSQSNHSYNENAEPALPATAKEESFGIIFTNNLNGENHSVAESESNSSTSNEHLFEPPAVLVAGKKDLQKCIRNKNYSYLYIQMELCQELTLHNWLMANNKEEDRVIHQMRNWLAQLVCAIDYIHKQGLIHRDLKPQNIFFSASDFATLKIGDLGLAINYLNTGEYDATKEAERHKHTSNVGTRLYMSPEQLRGRSYNEKVDVFSLGLIYTEMIIPFKTSMERYNTLFDLQKGKSPKSLLKISDSEQDFIGWLTTLDVNKRPSCYEIMNSEYVRPDIQLLGSAFDHNRSRSCSDSRISFSNL